MSNASDRQSDDNAVTLQRMFAVWRTLGHTGLEICENTIYFSLENRELKLFQNIESFVL